MDENGRRWSEDFGRVSTHSEAGPKFSIKGTMGYLYYEGPYTGGHEVLDKIIGLCRREGAVQSKARDRGSPMNNASSYTVYYDLLDGGLRIHSGNYFFQTRGAHIEGFVALRWILHNLGYSQPRKIKGEGRVPSDEELGEVVLTKADYAGPENR